MLISFLNKGLLVVVVLNSGKFNLFMRVNIGCNLFCQNCVEKYLMIVWVF